MSSTVPATKIRIPTPLRASTGGAAEVAVEARTVGAALAARVAAHPGLAGKITDERGELRRFVNVFVGSRNVRSLQGLETALEAGDELILLPAVAGGSR